MVWLNPIKFVIITMQMVAIAGTVKDLLDDFFMAEFFTFCEYKSIMQEIFQKMQSPESMDTSPNTGFLSLNDFEKSVFLSGKDDRSG